MRRFLWLFITILMVGLGLAARREIRARQAWPATMLVLAPAAEWREVTAEQRQGFALLFKDCLELGAGLPLVEEEAVLPEASLALDRLRLGVNRSGDLIRIQLVRSRAGKADERLETGLEPPAKALATAMAALGLEADAVRVLAPRNPENFWALAGLADLRGEEDLGDALGLSEELVAREPECAAAWLAKGRLGYMHLLTHVSLELDTQQQCEGDFVRALELAPDYPRAAICYGRFRADIGNQRGALDLLFTAIQHRPRVPRLYESVAYAARCAGLLEGALLSLRERDRLLGSSRGEANLTENTYLYLGDLERFEAVLGPGSNQQADSVRDFYRGYMRLIRGDRGGAEGFFARAQERPSGIPQFEALAAVYRLGLRGRTGEALAQLRKIWVARVPLRVPDGEYTFKLAEAFAFLGSAGEAQDVATRAFSQGFGCTRWFEQSPFLAGIHGTPRWNALLQHLQDRQQLMEGVYPRERFRY